MTSFYVDTDALKDALNITGTAQDDFLESTIVSASQAIDECCGTVFAQADAPDTRRYSPQSPGVCMVDELAEITLLEINRSVTGDDGSWVELPTYWTFPNSGGRPVQWVKPAPPIYFPFRIPQSVRVTGTFGWPEVPPAVGEAAQLLTEILWKRKTEAAMGWVGLDKETAARVLAYDPHLMKLIGPFSRATGELG